MPGWRTVHLYGDKLELPLGVELDLGATAKARAADLTAHAGGRGDRRAGCWSRSAATSPPPARSRARAGRSSSRTGRGPGRPVHPGQPGWAVATSSTVRRAWRRGGVRLHHIVDPRTAAPAAPVWRSVDRGRAHLCRGEHRLDRGGDPRPRGGTAGCPTAATPRGSSTSATASSASATGPGRCTRHERSRLLGPGPRHRHRRPRSCSPSRSCSASSPAPAGRVPWLGRFGTSDLHRTAALTGVGLVVVHVGVAAVRPLRPAQAGRLRLPLPRRVQAALAGPGHARGRPARRGHRGLAAAAAGRAEACSRPCTGRPTPCGPSPCSTRSATAPNAGTTLVPRARRGLHQRRRHGGRLAPHAVVRPPRLDPTSPEDSVMTTPVTTRTTGTPASARRCGHRPARPPVDRHGPLPHLSLDAAARSRRRGAG